MMLTVLEIVGKSKNGNKLARCLCECGNETVVRLNRALSGETKSCGCMKGSVTHGGTNTRIYSIATDIRKRCHNKNHWAYSRYGGRGITCPIKTSEVYEMLLKVPGYFEGATIDRIDNDASYVLENLRWATMKEQVLNSTICKPIEHYKNNAMNRFNFKRLCASRGLKFEDFVESYAGFKVGGNKMFFYELREAK